MTKRTKARKMTNPSFRDGADDDGDIAWESAYNNRFQSDHTENAG
jgi:hypothetical protein